MILLQPTKTYQEHFNSRKHSVVKYNFTKWIIPQKCHKAHWWRSGIGVALAAVKDRFPMVAVPIINSCVSTLTIFKSLPRNTFQKTFSSTWPPDQTMNKPSQRIGCHSRGGSFAPVSCDLSGELAPARSCGSVGLAAAVDIASTPWRCLSSSAPQEFTRSVMKSKESVPPPERVPRHRSFLGSRSTARDPLKRLLPLPAHRSSSIRPTYWKTEIVPSHWSVGHCVQAIKEFFWPLTACDSDIERQMQGMDSTPYHIRID